MHSKETRQRKTEEMGFKQLPCYATDSLLHCSFGTKRMCSLSHFNFNREKLFLFMVNLEINSCEEGVKADTKQRNVSLFCVCCTLLGIISDSLALKANCLEQMRQTISQAQYRTKLKQQH